MNFMESYERHFSSARSIIIPNFLLESNNWNNFLQSKFSNYGTLKRPKQDGVASVVRVQIVADGLSTFNRDELVKTEGSSSRWDVITYRRRRNYNPTISQRNQSCRLNNNKVRLAGVHSRWGKRALPAAGREGNLVRACLLPLDFPD